MCFDLSVFVPAMLKAIPHSPPSKTAFWAVFVFLGSEITGQYSEIEFC